MRIFENGALQETPPLSLGGGGGGEEGGRRVRISWRRGERGQAVSAQNERSRGQGQGEGRGGG